MFKRSREQTRGRAVALTAALALSFTWNTATTPAHAESLAGPAQTQAVSNEGITVIGQPVKVGERTWRYTLADPAVDAAYATHSKKLSVDVMLPESYAARPERHYPSIYLLHGRGGGIGDWLGLDAEKLTAGSDTIVVMPEGGKASWYTDWVNDQGHRQDWETFHIRHLIPFIDSTFRTLASGKHRAIGGVSMGGVGAFIYAGKHPDKFAHVSSYSGGPSLQHPLEIAAVSLSIGMENLSPWNGPFGNPLGGTWAKNDPKNRLPAFRAMGISMYTGDGSRGLSLDRDRITSGVIEFGAMRSTSDMANALRKERIPFHLNAYGRSASAGGYSCDGMHSPECWKMDLHLDLPRILAGIRPGAS